MPKGDFILVTCLHLRRDHGAICIFHSSKHWIMEFILGDPGADSGGEGKSKQAGKYGTREK